MLRIFAGCKGQAVKETNLADYIAKYSMTEHDSWINATAPSEEELNFLKDNFDIHPLVLEDSLTPFHLPKIEAYPQNLFVVWQVLNDNPETEEIENSQISFLLGKNFLITIQQEKIGLVEELLERAPKDNEFFCKGVDWIMRSVLDESSEGYFPIVDDINEQVDTIEDQVFEEPDQKHLKLLFNLKHKLMMIRKVVAPQRDAVAELVHFEKYVRQENLAYFRDIYDRLIRVLDLADSTRDVISGSMDIYLSSVSNRLNEVMKKLTILATIFGPLTIITGIYGMNFRYFPELTYRYSYFIVLGAMAVFAVGMFIYFKSKEWW